MLESNDPKNPASANAPGSQDYLELEQLLSRIESSSNHYELLAIPRSASGEDVIRAYKEALALFHLCYSATNETWADALRTRADQSVQKLTDAYRVLSNYGKRVEYDNLRSGRHCKPLQLDIQPRAAPQAEVPGPEPQAQPRENPLPFVRDPKSVVLPDQDALTGSRIAARSSAYSICKADRTDDDRRRVARYKLSLPAYVVGHDRTTGRWQEIARTRDVSRFGAALEMRRRVPQGIVLRLSLPMPVKLRNHGYADQGYNTYAIARRVGIPKDYTRVIGVEFLGESPPADYLAEPWRIFRTEPWNGPDRRRTPREKTSERIGIEYLDESTQKMGEEVAQAEDISAGGIRVKVRSAPSCFDFVRITRLNDGFQSLAALCDRFIGIDDAERLCLCFIK